MAATPEPDGAPKTSTKTNQWESEPDAWRKADLEWNRPWPPPDEAWESAPRPEAYKPSVSNAGSVSRAYGAGMREAGPYLGLGAQIAMSMLFFVGLGYAADRFAGTSPWGVLVGSLLGMVAIALIVVRLVREANAESETRRSEKNRSGQTSL